MPTYDYQCRKCGHVTEVIHSMLEEGPTACERCGGELRRVFHPTGIIFKGGGFYKTDSRSAGSTSGTGGSASSAAQKPSGADGAGPAAPSDGAGSSGSGSSPSAGKPAEPGGG